MSRSVGKPALAFNALIVALDEHEKELKTPDDMYYNGGRLRWYTKRRSRLLETIEDYATAVAKAQEAGES